MTADTKHGTAILAGGCFWGMEEIMRSVPGVVATQAGYCGGNTDNPGYDDVKTGSTGHAECIKVEYDGVRLTYAALLDLFFTMHDPTTPDRQGNDVGSQYRSAIFYLNPEQRLLAADAVKKAQSYGLWKRPVVTAIVPAGRFWPAEEYHQEYLKKHPGGYTCHYVRSK